MHPKSMFHSKNRNNVYPCKPNFSIMYIKVGSEGSALHGHGSMMTQLTVPMLPQLFT